MGQRETKIVSLEDLVPADHLQRKIDQAISFAFIYDEVRGMYVEKEWGNPGIAPVTLFKIVFIQYLFGIRSMRQTIREIEVNVAYRWFIGYDLFEKIPHFSTFGKNYSRRFAGTDIFERIFLRILEQAVECGLFHKGEHEQQFAYVAGVACDRHNFVLGYSIAPGNTNNSTMFSQLYRDVTERFPEVEAVAVDAGYKIPAIMKEILDSGRIPCAPYRAPQTGKGFFKKYEYVYDEYYDCILCPADQVLKYTTTNRVGYREYKSNPAVCRDCPKRMQCTHSKSCQKTVTRHIWESYMEQAEDYRYTRGTG